MAKNDLREEEIIQEGEILEEAASVVNDKGENKQAADFLHLEGLVKQYIAAIAKLQGELKEKSQMLNDALEGDAVYNEHTEKAKEANKIKNATRQQILKQPALAELSERIKDLKFDVKEHQVLLSDYLAQYQKASGATQIEDEEGEVLEIVSVVKLVKRSSKFDR